MDANLNGRPERNNGAPEFTGLLELSGPLDEATLARMANEFFATLKSSERYSFLYRIHDAKRPETRTRRIREYVAMLADGRTIHGPG